MITFIVPLKSQAASINWATVQQLFHRTLGSLINQKHQDYRVIAIGHDRPNSMHLDRPEVRWVNVDYPPPGHAESAKTMQDKWRKVLMGLLTVDPAVGGFLMIVDADDLVSNRLAGHVAAYPNCNGWILKSGYSYKENSRFVQINENYNCGTNAIINSKVINLPETEADKGSCVMLTAGHTIIESEMAAQGTPLEPLPFRGGIYVYAHGDNDSSINNPARQYLQRTMQLLGYDQVKDLSYCIWDSVGEVRFGAKPLEADVQQHVLESHDMSGIRNRCITLNRLLEQHSDNQQLALVKMDIEGAEVRALSAADKLLLSANPPAWIVEVYQSGLKRYDAVPDDIIAFFPDERYELFFINFSHPNPLPQFRHNTIYRLSDNQHDAWPYHLNLVAIPRCGKFASRSKQIEHLLP